LLRLKAPIEATISSVEFRELKLTNPVVVR
jgi:hypothetical protein